MGPSLKGNGHESSTMQQMQTKAAQKCETTT